MSASWLLYYAMLAAHIVGGGYAMIFGRNLHRVAVGVVVVGVVLQFALCALASTLGHSIDSVCVVIDMVDNGVMCSAFLGMALLNPKASWLLVIILLQAAELALDGLVFGSEPAPLRSGFADAANALNILVLVVIAVAAALRRGRESATPSTSPAE